MGNIRTGFGRDLGRHLRALREQAGLTQVELGRRLELDAAHAQSYLSRLEAGHKGTTSLATVVRYVRACGGRVAEFIAQMEDAGVLPGMEEVSGRSPAVTREQKTLSPTAPPEPTAARALKRERARLERRVVATVRAAFQPIVLAWQDRLPNFGWVALANSAPFFIRAWKRACRRSGQEDAQAALRVEFDAVVAQGEKGGLPRAALDEVRARAEQLLMPD